MRSSLAQRLAAVVLAVAFLLASARCVQFIQVRDCAPVDMMCTGATFGHNAVPQLHTSTRQTCIC